jgi:hypothetical protein
MSADETDEGSSGEEGTYAAASGSKPKRWVWSDTDAYFVNLLIKTCVEIHEYGKVIPLPHIHAKVMEIWHRRCIYC